MDAETVDAETVDAETVGTGRRKGSVGIYGDLWGCCGGRGVSHNQPLPVSTCCLGRGVSHGWKESGDWVWICCHARDYKRPLDEWFLMIGCGFLGMREITFTHCPVTHYSVPQAHCSVLTEQRVQYDAVTVMSPAPQVTPS